MHVGKNTFQNEHKIRPKPFRPKKFGCVASRLSPVNRGSDPNTPPTPLKFRAAGPSCTSTPIFNSQKVSPLLTELHSNRTDSNPWSVRTRVACQKAHYLPRVNNLCLHLLLPPPLHAGTNAHSGTGGRSANLARLEIPDGAHVEKKKRKKRGAWDRPCPTGPG